MTKVKNGAMPPEMMDDRSAGKRRRHRCLGVISENKRRMDGDSGGKETVGSG